MESNVLSFLPGIIDRPAKTFEEMEQRTKRRWLTWLVPVVVMILSMALLNVVRTTYMQPPAEMQQAAQSSSQPRGMGMGMGPMGRVAGGGQSMTLPPYVAPLMALGGPLVVWLSAAVILFLGSLLVGGEMRFGGVFNVVVWSTIPSAVRNLVTAAYIALTGTMVRYTGLSALVGTGNVWQDMGSLLYIVLSRVDLLFLWSVFLMVLGLGIVARISKTKSMFIVAFWVVLYLGLPVVFRLFM